MNQDLGSSGSEGRKSYVVKTAGGSELRRNKVQLKLSGERVPTSEEQLDLEQSGYLDLVSAHHTYMYGDTPPSFVSGATTDTPQTSSTH